MDVEGMVEDGVMYAGKGVMDVMCRRRGRPKWREMNHVKIRVTEETQGRTKRRGP